MGWVIRPGRRPYYTRSKKRGGKVFSEHVGGGSVGELAAAADALKRAERRARLEARRAEKARWQAALAPLQELCREADLLVKATLLVAGYHQHARSSWRKRHAPEHVHR
jgi:hypothetical protein